MARLITDAEFKSKLKQLRMEFMHGSKAKQANIGAGNGLIAVARPPRKGGADCSVTWTVRVLIGKDARGKPAYRSETIGAYPKLGLANARKKAEETARRIKEETDPKAIALKGARLSINELYAEWYKHKQADGLRGGTLKGYRSTIKHLACFDGFRLTDLTTALIAAKLKQMDVSPCVRRKCAVLLRQMLRFAANSGYIPSNPAADLLVGTESPIAKHVSKHWKAVKADELRHLVLEPTRNLPMLQRAFFLLTLMTASRCDEIRTLKWKDINTAGVLRDGSRHPAIEIETTKTGEPRTIPMTKQVIALIETIREMQGDSQSDYVFQGRRPNKPLNPVTLTGRLSRCTQGATTLHGFRSTFRTWGGGTAHRPPLS